MPSNTTAGDFISLYGDFTIPDFWLQYGVQSTGYIIPTFEELIQREIDLFRDAFSITLDIDPSSPEGQYIYNEAKDKYSLLLMGQATYNSFSLTNSSGQSLDRNLQYIGIMRKDDSRSQATVVFDTIDGITPVTLSVGYQFANQQGKSFQITNTITFTSATDAATISLGIASDDVAGLLAAVAISTGTPFDAGMQDGIQTAVAATASEKTTAATRTIDAVVAVESLTAGVLVVILEYVVLE